MDKNDALEAARAVERGEAPSGAVILKLTGDDSLTTPGATGAIPNQVCLNCGQAIFIGTFAPRWEPDVDPYDDPVVWRHVRGGYAACAGWGAFAAPKRPERFDQCDETCTVDCGHCKGEGHPDNG